MTLDDLLEQASPSAGNEHMFDAGSLYREPVAKCGHCGQPAHAEWVDIGFGPYSQQAGPFHCYACGWTERGCPQEECVGTQCQSWEHCKGEALVGANPISGQHTQEGGGFNA